MIDFLRDVFTTGPFMPHGHCYLWLPELVWLHVTTDSLIGLAYYIMPIILVYFVRKRQDLPFNWMFLMFGLFIIACGTTHLMSIWNLWYPDYWLAGGVKAITAAVSLMTASLLVPLVPKALALPSPSQLEALNRQLHEHIRERARAEAALRQANAELMQANADLHDEITQRQQAEAQLKTALHQKDVLFREVHHRVKNNLQIISSLLSLQSRYITDPQMLQTFNDTRNRIRSMALIHGVLDQASDFSQVDFSRYMNQLTTHLCNSYGVNAKAIVVKTYVSGVLLNTEVAVACGLIVHELVSNSLKHAFADDRKGEIRVYMHHKNSQYTLTVTDNGIGLPAAFTPQTSKSLGFRLILALANQLNGNLDFESNGETRFSITFADDSVRS
jgi:two-component sensor histidine kinase